MTKTFYGNVALE